ncbi:MAG: hypothetical protein AAB929_05685, partial [Patescibacteria group bacterium]
VQDNDFSTWRAYDNRYWPAKYIIDKDGVVRYSHFGEGNYDETEKVIQELLKETGAKNVPPQIKNSAMQTFGRTPEAYLGSGRIAYFSSPETIRKDTFTSYSYPSSLSENTFAFKGKWNIMNDYAVPQRGSELVFNFDAKEVFLVMKIVGKPSKVKVYVDDKVQYFGEHNINGVVTVDSDKLYKLVFLPSPGRHILKLEFDDSNAQLFAFTFG